MQVDTDYNDQSDIHKRARSRESDFGPWRERRGSLEGMNNV